MATLDENRWASIPLAEQMANIGSEVGRSAKWLSKGKMAMAEGAYLRALDLIDLTIKYGRLGQNNRAALLKEICRARDCFTESFSNSDFETLSYLDRYFGQFAISVRA